MKNKLFLFVYLFMLVVITSCGGGGGGGGVVAFQNNSQMHNGADAGGWGSGNQTGGGFGGNSSLGGSSELLFESIPSFFSPIDHIDISLVINGSPAEFTGLDTSAKKDVLGLNNGDKVSGTAVIPLADGSTRTDTVQETTIGIDNKLSFAVTYRYILRDSSNSNPSDAGTYTSSGGINVSGINWIEGGGSSGNTVIGWKTEAGATYAAGGIIYGLTGDVKLTSVYGSSGAPVLTATVATSTLYAEQSNPLGVDGGQTTITITGATGTPTVATVNSSQASLLTFGTPMPDANDASKYTVSVAIASDTDTDNFNKVWFSDSTNVSIQATDPSGATSTPLSLTLCNMYGYQLMQSDGTLDSSATVLEGTTLSFDTAKTTVGTDVSGREIVAFKNASGNVVLCEKTNPGPTSIAFNSTNFNKRLVSLTAVPVFTYTVKDANDNNLTQTGTQADPYILKFNGTAAEKGLHVSVPTGEFVGLINTTFDTSNVLSRSLGSSPYNNPGIGIMNTLTIAEIPSTPVKVTLADSGTGATRDFYVKIQSPFIGTKAAPDALGDIVFKDGSAMTSAQFNALDAATQNAKKADAVAVIFNTTDNLGVALAESSSLDWNDASSYCSSYTCPNFTTDWRLPTYNELLNLAVADVKTSVNTALAAVGGTPLSDNFYWSSGEYLGTMAWVVDLTNHNGDAKDKTDNLRARAVRQF
ncbi:MAG: DUF1566 domain-containing protein [Spirochaetaceae bacterium]|nr:DUF1566 domain-containing protein [Spirochaetaceae bacterium]